MTAHISKLLRLPEVRTRTGLPTSTLYAMMSDEKFPRPVKLSARSVAWDETLVTDWIEARLSEEKTGQNSDKAA